MRFVINIPIEVVTRLEGKIRIIPDCLKISVEAETQEAAVSQLSSKLQPLVKGEEDAVHEG